MLKILTCEEDTDSWKSHLIDKLRQRQLELTRATSSEILASKSQLTSRPCLRVKATKDFCITPLRNDQYPGDGQVAAPVGVKDRMIFKNFPF